MEVTSTTNNDYKVASNRKITLGNTPQFLSRNACPSSPIRNFQECDESGDMKSQYERVQRKLNVVNYP